MNPNSSILAPPNPHHGLVRKLLRDHGQLSRTQISDATGLSPTTISKAVAPLIARGQIREIRDESPHLIGRPAIMLVPIYEATTVCGVEIGIGSFHIGLSDANANVRGTKTGTFDLALAPDEVLGLIAGAVAETIAQDGGADCIGIGISVPSPVDSAQRSLLLSINLGWQNIGVADFLESRLGLPVVVAHDAPAMALAESNYGSHLATRVAYVHIRAGIGLGVVARGSSLAQNSIPESYLGHTRIVQNGPLCACGAHGCLEALISEPYLAGRLRGVDEKLWLQHLEGANVLELLEGAVADGNQQAQDIRGELLEHLATGLAIVANLFSPDLILLGGIFSSAPAHILIDLRRLTASQIFPLLRETTRIESAAPGPAINVAGAAAAWLESRYYA